MHPPCVLAVIDPFVASLIVGLILSAASLVISELLRPKPDLEDARPGKDFEFPTATEGRVIPVIFGTEMQVSMNTVWWGDRRQKKIKETIRTGLFSSESIVKGFKYYVGFQGALCVGQIDAIRRIWIGEELVSNDGVQDGVVAIDKPKLFGGNDQGSGGVVGDLRVFSGAQGQAASTYLAAFQSPLPSYTGLCYILWEGGYIGNSTQIKPWKFEIQRFPNGLAITGNKEATDAFVVDGGTTYLVGDVLTLVGGSGISATYQVESVENGAVTSVSTVDRGSYTSTPTSPASTIGGTGTGCTLGVLFFGPEMVNGADANLACVAYELFTDDDWGFGFDPSRIDVASFIAAGQTLKSEGNGFSFLMDRPMEATDFLQEIERQMDGVIFLDRRTGKFVMNLIRGGYDIDTVQQVDDSSNLKNITDFTRGTWDGTTNFVQVGFEDRNKEYFETFAIAQDLANQRIQNGEIVLAQMTFPGIKDRSLANQIASRELRAFSTPLAKATVTTDRTLSSINPGDVVALTDSTLGISKFPMRVLNANFGTLENGTITLGLVQDVFGFAEPIFADPDGPRWVPPVQNVVPPPTDEIKVFETPVAFARRDPDFPGVIDRVWATSRNQNGVAVSQKIYSRDDPVTPSGLYTEVGEVFGFALIGTLGLDLGRETPNPTTAAVRLDPGADDVEDFLEVLADASDSDVGGPNLANLLLVDDEFIAGTIVLDQTTHVSLGSVYRGMLDTVPADHTAGTPIWLLTAGGGHAQSGVPRTNVVDVQLRPVSPDSEATEAESNTVQIQMANRARRPYPPVELIVNGDRYPAEVDIDDLMSGGSTLDERGIEVAFTRRDFRTFDEVEGILNDAESLDPTFPTNNSTAYKMEVIEDPLGAATTLAETAYNSGEASVFLSRTKILRETGGAIPTSIEVQITARHVFNGGTLESTQKAGHDFNSVSGILANDTNMGVIALNVVSGKFIMPAFGQLNFTLGTALPSGDVEVRVNGGSFLTLISSPDTTNNLSGLIPGDEIEVRHTQTGDNSSEVFLQVDVPGNNSDGYAILTY